MWRDARPGSTGNDIYYARRDPATGAWSANERVNNVTTGNQQEPRVGVDDAGNVYVLWTDLRNTSDADIYFSKRTASTGVWSASVRVNDDGAGKRQDFPSLAVRPNGEAIAVWRDQRGGGQKYHVYSSRLAAGATSWATNRIVTSNASALKERTGLAVGSTGIAYAVWHDERDGNADVWFSSLPAGGTTWSTNTKISDDAGTAAQTNPDIGVDGSGNLIAVWEDVRATPRQVRARHKPAAGSWSSSVAVSAADSREPSLALRTDGHAHLAWHNGPAVVGSTQSVWTADFDPGPATWSTPEQLSQLAAGTASGRASAAMDGSRTVVMFDGGPQTPSYNPEILARVRTAASGTDGFAYGYDRLSRLTSVTNPGDDAGYTYDPVGNRLTRTLGAATTTYSYDRADRISAAGPTTFTVNAVGATTARGTDTFAYDQINRLTSATVAGTTETNTYDGDGVRFSRQVGAGPVMRYVTDPTAGLPVSISDGTRKYVWGVGLVYAVSGSDIEVYHADRLGSIRAITDDAGNLVASYRSDEFGNPATSSGASSQPFRFTGEPLDGTGLTYLRARYYDPNLGRFASRDPWAGAVNRPQSLNRYVYVENAPIGKRDPSGQCLVDTAADAAFIVYDLVSLAFGPEKEREGNLIALGADVGAVFIPCATGAGMLVRVGRAATHVPEQIVLRVEDLIHIAERHLPGGVLTAGRSVFYDPNDVMRLIRQAETVVPSVQANGNLAFVVDAGREIGFDRVTGGATSIYTVITRPDRSVVTMFPGLP